MKIDSAELQRISSVVGMNRLHLYTTIHKALRARMGQVLVGVGQMDAGDDGHCREVVADVEQLLYVMHGHLETENAFLHPAIEARHPGALTEIVADHAAQELVIERLRQHAQAILALSGGERAAFCLNFYRELAVFVADNLTHMQEEEHQNQQLLWSAYSDAELHEIHGAILASLPPEKMTVILPWMISAISHAERLPMFEDMRANAPAPVFSAALGVARACLAEREWKKLSGALGLVEASKPVAYPMSYV